MTTNEFIDFVGTHLAKHIRPPTFSKKSREFLGNLLEIMKKAKQYIEIESDAVSKSATFTDDLPIGYNYDFFPEEIKTRIHQMKRTCCKLSFQIHNRQYEIAIVYENKPKVEIIACLKKIKAWLMVAQEYAPERCSQKMNIYIYFTDVMKRLPFSRGTNIGQSHANTAFTTHCKKVTELNLFREEEWFKVLIHETFHNMGLDFSEYDTPSTDKHILKLFPIQCDVRLYEAYCETWAEILNILFTVVFFSNKNAGRENLLRKFEKMVHLEQGFSLFQMVKMLDHYGLQYEDLIEKTENAHYLRSTRYKENTNAFSYYVLKTICLYNIDEFLQFCIEQNGESLRFAAISLHLCTFKPPTSRAVMSERGDTDCAFQMRNGVKKKGGLLGAIRNYCNFIEEHYKTSIFLEDIRKVESERKGASPSIARTMRMSLFG